MVRPLAVRNTDHVELFFMKVLQGVVVTVFETFQRQAARLEILSEGGRVKGVRLASGEDLYAPVVVNVAGPGSSIVNRCSEDEVSSLTTQYWSFHLRPPERPTEAARLSGGNAEKLRLLA